MAERKKRVQFTTPRGMLSYPYLTGKGRDYNGNGDFRFQTKMVFEPGAETDALVAQLDALAEEGLADINLGIAEKNRTLAAGKAKVNPKKALNFDLYSRDEETGKVTVSFKAPIEIKARTGAVYSNAPRFFDAKGTLVEGTLPIGSGTIARLSYTAYNWLSPIGCGVRLEPKGVQVLQFVEYTGGGGNKTAAEFGFGAEEGYSFDGADTIDVDEAPAGFTAEKSGAPGAGEV